MDRCTLLVVDDDPLWSSALVRSVRGLPGLRTLTATTSRRAREIATAEAIDAAVIDLLLGDESGVDLIAHVRRELPALPIAAVTAAASSPIIEAARAAGATVVLRKPMSLGGAAHALGIEHEGLLSSYRVEHASLELAMWEHVQRVYSDLDGNVLRTARVLGISRTTLKKQLAKTRPPA